MSEALRSRPSPTARHTGRSPRDRSRRLRALVRKEFYQVGRDPSSILIAAVLPLILLFLFGYGVSLDATRTRLGVAVETSTPAAESLAASFEASHYFDVTRGRDRRQLEDDLILGRVRGVVIVPATFADDLSQRRVPQIQVLVDGSDPNTASFVQNYVQGVVARWLEARTAETAAHPPLIRVEPRFWFNAELSSRNFLVPGSIAIIMTLVGTLLTSLVVSREWERGTMEALMATPVTAGELLAGKVLPYFALGLVAMTICVLLAIFVFDVPFRGSFLALYALSASFLLPALGQGILISAIAKNQFLASQMALLTGFLPAFLLSGFLFEIDSMPRIIQLFTLVVPARYLIPSLQTVFLAGDVWRLFLPNIAILLVAGALLFRLAAGSTRKRIG
jgi:ABC-2 type transport system permease protein